VVVVIPQAFRFVSRRNIASCKVLDPESERYFPQGVSRLLVVILVRRSKIVSKSLVLCMFRWSDVSAGESYGASPALVAI